MFRVCTWFFSITNIFTSTRIAFFICFAIRILLTSCDTGIVLAVSAGIASVRRITPRPARMVEAVISFYTISGCGTGSHRRNALCSVPILPVFTNNLASAFAVRITALLETPAILLFRAFHTLAGLFVDLLAVVATRRHADPLTVRYFVVVRTAAVFTQRTVYTISGIRIAFFRFRTTYTGAFVFQLTSAITVGFVIVRTPASAVSV